VLPGSDVNPAGQSVQIEDPSVEYFPAGQVPEQDAVCNPLVAPHVPAGQSVQEDAPAREYFPRPQVPVQDALVNPVVAPHVPAAQSVHVDALANAYFPIGQIVHPAARLVPAHTAVFG
jgi:hypothetical protein